MRLQYGINLNEILPGSVNKERVLIFILARSEGYAREIADYNQTDLRPIQQPLAKLKTGNVKYSRLSGKTKLYAFNPRYPFLKELKALLEKTITFHPGEEQKNLLYNRQRPHRPGKP